MTVDVELARDVGEGGDQLARLVEAVHSRQRRIDPEIAAVDRGLVDALDGVFEDAAVMGIAIGGRRIF